MCGVVTALLEEWGGGEGGGSCDYRGCYWGCRGGDVLGIVLVCLSAKWPNSEGTPS
jgi:hypothetical protein